MSAARMASPGPAGFLAFALALLATTACGRPGDGSEAAGPGHGTPATLVADEHDGHGSHSADGPAPPTGPAPPGLAIVRSEPVQGRTGPGGAPFEVVVRDPGRAGHDRLIGRRSFEISLRHGRGVEYPCESCHRAGQPVVRPERVEDAHRNVLPRHPDPQGTACLTCHAPDRVDALVLASGERVPLAHAYRLCGQCHYPQADGWAAGAHGKRLDGWRGRRVVMGCADCHDPHRPAIEPRIPFPGPRIPRTRPSTP